MMWLKDRFIIPKTDIALFAAVLHCLLHFKSLLIQTPRSFSLSQHNSCVCLLLSCRKYWPISTAPNFMTLHFSVLKLRSHCSDQLSNVSKSLWRASVSSWLFWIFFHIGKHLDWTVTHLHKLGTGCTNHLIGPHQTLTDLNGPHRALIMKLDI